MRHSQRSRSSSQGEAAGLQVEIPRKADVAEAVLQDSQSNGISNMTLRGVVFHDRRSSHLCYSS